MATLPPMFLRRYRRSHAVAIPTTPVASSRAPMPLEVRGLDAFALDLAWNEIRDLEALLFLTWSETSTMLEGIDLPLDWTEWDLLGALDLTWRELPAGFTDLFGAVQRPYGRGTKTPNP